MPSGSKKRKSAKKSRQDEPEGASDISEETPNTSEESENKLRPEEGQEEQCLTPKTPVRENESDDKGRMGMQISEWVNVSDRDARISTWEGQKTTKREEPSHPAFLGDWETVSQDSTLERPEDVSNPTLMSEIAISSEHLNIKEDEKLCGFLSADVIEVASSQHEAGLGDSAGSFSTEWDSVAGIVGEAGADLEEVGQHEAGTLDGEAGDLEEVVGELEDKAGVEFQEVVRQAEYSADDIKVASPQQGGDLGDPAEFLSNEWDSVEGFVGKPGVDLEEVGRQQPSQPEGKAGADPDGVGQQDVVELEGMAGADLEEASQQVGEPQHADSPWPAGLEEESQVDQASIYQAQVWVPEDESNNQNHFSETELAGDGADLVMEENQQASESEVNLAFSSGHINDRFGIDAKSDKFITDSLSQLCESVEKSLSHHGDSNVDSGEAGTVAETGSTFSSELQVTTSPDSVGAKLLHVEELPVATIDSKLESCASIFSTNDHGPIDERKLDGEAACTAEDQIVCGNGKDIAATLSPAKIPLKDACEEHTCSDITTFRDDSLYTDAECSSNRDNIDNQSFDQDKFQTNAKFIRIDQDGGAPCTAEESGNGKDIADALFTAIIPVEDACEGHTYSDMIEIRDESLYSGADCSNNLDNIDDQNFDQDEFRTNAKLIHVDELNRVTTQEDNIAAIVLEDEGRAAPQIAIMKLTDDALLYSMIPKNQDGAVESLDGEKGSANLGSQGSDVNIKDTIASPYLDEEPNSRLDNGDQGRGLCNYSVNDHKPGNDTLYQDPEESSYEPFVEGPISYSSESTSITNEHSQECSTMLTETFPAIPTDEIQKKGTIPVVAPVEEGVLQKDCTDDSECKGSCEKSPDLCMKGAVDSSLECTDKFHATGIIHVIAPVEEEDVTKASTGNSECKDSCEESHEPCMKGAMNLSLECTAVIKDCSNMITNTEKDSQAVCMEKSDLGYTRETDSRNVIESQDSCSYKLYMEGTLISSSECPAVTKEQSLDHSNILASIKDVIQAVCTENESTGLPVIVHVGEDLQSDSSFYSERQGLCENGIEPYKEVKGGDIKCMSEYEADNKDLDCPKNDTEETVPTESPDEIQASSLCVTSLREEESSNDTECQDPCPSSHKNYEDKVTSPNDQSLDCSDMPANREEAIQAVYTDNIQATSFPVVVSVREEEYHVNKRTLYHSKQEDVAVMDAPALGQKHITKWWECCGFLELLFHKS